MIPAKSFSCGQAANIARTSLPILKFVNCKFHTQDGRPQSQLHKEKGLPRLVVSHIWFKNKIYSFYEKRIKSLACTSEA